MLRVPSAKIYRHVIAGVTFAAALTAGVPAIATVDGCPDSASEISTDRPDTTNSSQVVPYGSLQAENGVDWTVRQRSDVVSGTETRVRLGIAHCTEVLADVPTYFYSLNGQASSGFSDVVASIKRAGLNSSSPNHFFGVGYSLRLDRLFGGSVGNSP